MPSVYEEAFRRWRAVLSARALVREARVETRLAPGLGTETVWETGLSFLRPYGVPYIPGSSLKGAARAYGSRALHQAIGHDEARDIVSFLFGSPERRGAVVLYDAWYVPRSAPGDCPWVLDVTTSHHPAYYTGPTQVPTDADDPNPVLFLSVQGKFLLAVEGEMAAARLAMKILEKALAEEGVGGKRSSGYGRLSVLPVEEGAEDLPAVRELRGVPKDQLKGQIGNFVQRWRQEPDPARRRLLGTAIWKRLEEIRDPKWVRNRGWYEELRAYMEGTE